MKLRFHRHSTPKGHDTTGGVGIFWGQRMNEWFVVALGSFHIHLGKR